MRQERRQSKILEIAQRNWWWFCRRMYEATRFPLVPPRGERKKTLHPAPIRDLSHLLLGGINSPAPLGCIAWVQMGFCKAVWKPWAVGSSMWLRDQGRHGQVMPPATWRPGAAAVPKGTWACDHRNAGPLLGPPGQPGRQACGAWSVLTCALSPVHSAVPNEWSFGLIYTP